MNVSNNPKALADAQLDRNVNSNCSYLANKHFENRMLKDRVRLELVHLPSAGGAAHLLLQSIIR